MFDVIRKVLALLSPRERRAASMLLGLILVMAMLDAVGIASIMPFLAVLASPEIVQSNRWLNEAYTSLDFREPTQFLIFLGSVMFALLVFSISFKAITTWAIMRFAQMRNYSISLRLVSGYLRQPYEWFLNRNSAELGKMVLSEVELVINNSVIPLLQLLVQLSVAVAILALLILVDPMLALLVGGGMAGIYVVTYIGLRRLLDHIGRERVAANARRFKAISEAFGGIKEIKLGATESAAIDRFEQPAMQLARTRVMALMAELMPRYVLEIVAFGGMLLLVVFLLDGPRGLDGALPIIGLYALAGYRLMPALQMTYGNATKLRFGNEALDQLHRDIDNLDAFAEQRDRSVKTLLPSRSISLRDVSYCYPDSERVAVSNLCLEIPLRSVVGFVGATGSGKTTTVDIILGLLVPTKGSVQVDGAEVTDTNRRDWQRVLGYVPQDIFLADQTVASNIAFGVPASEVDRLAVERAARTANLHNFVAAELPSGYDTIVGERGVRLSGGQRQRIGIARALYHNPKVLILDEATSALDNLTEQAVMDAVHNLGGEITIIIIAHRLSTVRDCDRIFVLDRGELVGEGTFDELNASNDRFREMARA